MYSLKALRMLALFYRQVHQRSLIVYKYGSLKVQRLLINKFALIAETKWFACVFLVYGYIPTHRACIYIIPLQGALDSTMRNAVF